MVLPFAATNIQPGLFRHAGVVMSALRLRNVLTTTIDFLSQTGALQCRFVVLSVFFSVHPLADVRRTVLKLDAVRLAIP
jgi:hypothetical protein